MPRLAIQSSSATRIVLEGRELLYFGGCGYLGLAHHPRVVAAVVEGVQRYGASAAASRETTGNCVAYDELELELARRVGMPAAVLTPEGYTANFVAAQALARQRRVALIDERSHASLFDAAHAARLEVHTWKHGALEHLEELLAVHAERAVVVSDGVFASRGEIAPVQELTRLVRAVGAALWIDDCHGTGVIGSSGRGCFEHAAVQGEDLVLTSTLSKALGCYGGFAAGSASFVATAREHSQAYIGSTPPPPPLAHAALVALSLAYDEPERLARLRRNCARFRGGLRSLGLPTPREDLPVFAFVLPQAEAMLAVHEVLLHAGLYAPLVRYLGSPATGNFRIALNAEHTDDDLGRLLAGLARGLGRAGS